MRKTTQKGRRGNRELLRDRAISHPPQINGSELRHSMTMRYVLNAAFAGDITFQNLLDTYLVAATATTAFDVFQTVRIRRVRIWAVPVAGAATSVWAEFRGTTAGVLGDQAWHSDTSMGVQPAHVDARPSAKSLASDYQLGTSAVALGLSVPAGAVVDVELSFRGQFVVTQAAQNAVVGAAAGGFYLRGLDGLPIATTKFTPEIAGAAI